MFAALRQDQIFPGKTVRGIIEAAASFDQDGDVGRMVPFVQALPLVHQRIRVGDVQSDRLRILVPTSRKGRGEVGGHHLVQAGQDVIDRLRPAMASRRKDEPLLCRWPLVQVTQASAEGLARPFRRDVVPDAVVGEGRRCIGVDNSDRVYRDLIYVVHR